MWHVMLSLKVSRIELEQHWSVDDVYQAIVVINAIEAGKPPPKG
jgi:hypothetical protein